MKNAFLNGELLEEVYMDASLGFEDMFTKGKVCKLQSLSMASCNLLEPSLIGSRESYGEMGTLIGNQIILYL